MPQEFYTKGDDQYMKVKSLEFLDIEDLLINANNKGFVEGKIVI